MGPAVTFRPDEVENIRCAAALLGAADWEVMDRPLQTYGHLYPFHEACVQSGDEELGDRRFKAAFENGRAFSIAEGIAYALGEQPPPAPLELSRRTAGPAA